MPAPLFHEWMAYDQLEPIAPGPRLEEMLAEYMAMYGNVHRNPRTKPEIFRKADFMLDRFDAPRLPSQTPQQTWGMVKAWAMINGATKPQ